MGYAYRPHILSDKRQVAFMEDADRPRLLECFAQYRPGFDPTARSLLSTTTRLGYFLVLVANTREPMSVTRRLFDAHRRCDERSLSVVRSTYLVGR